MYSLKQISTTVLICTIMYFSHAIIEKTYHYKCRLNLFQVVLYGNSDMCNIMKFVLDKIEFSVKSVIVATTKSLG